jgi:putative oxidoreductase
MISERYAPMTYALFRMVFGFLFLSFGLQKMFGWFGGNAAPLMTMQGAAGVIETVTGLLIMIGFLTKFAAFIASGEMAVAFFYIHVGVIAMGQGGAGLPTGFHPLLNMGERATLFCFAFLYIATRGSGIWSVDAARTGTPARAVAA